MQETGAARAFSSEYLCSEPFPPHVLAPSAGQAARRLGSEEHRSGSGESKTYVWLPLRAGGQVGRCPAGLTGRVVPTRPAGYPTRAVPPAAARQLHLLTYTTSPVPPSDRTNVARVELSTFIRDRGDPREERQGRAKSVPVVAGSTCMRDSRSAPAAAAAAAAHEQLRLAAFT